MAIRSTAAIREPFANARELIDKHKYERRRDELNDAEEMAKSW